jgi:hypothetical protein
MLADKFIFMVLKVTASDEYLSAYLDFIFFGGGGGYIRLQNDSLRILL